MLRLGCSQSVRVAARTTSALTNQFRFGAPRQYAPKGYRDAASRLPMTPEFAEECNDLAKIAHQSKNFGDAVTLYDRALAMRREVHGPIHVKCAATLHNIGRVFIDMKEYSSAENALSEAAAIYEEVEGPQSLKYAESLALLAHAYAHIKFLDESEKAFKDAIKVYRDQLYNFKDSSWLPSDREPIKDPNLHPLSAVAHALADCATLFLQRGMEDTAIKFLEEALEIRRFLYSRHQKFRPMIAQTLNKLAEIKKHMGDAVGAEMCISECIDICVATLGRDSSATAQAISTKASLCVAKKNFREGLKLFEESATTFGVTLGKEHPIFGQELIKLGRAQELSNEFSAAERTYRKGLEVLTKATGKDSLQAAEALTCLGQLLLRKRELDQAIEHLRRAVAIRKGVDRFDPQLCFLYWKLGEAFAQKKEHHAEAYFMLALDHFRESAKRESVHRSYITDVLDDLGLFYLEYGHVDKAEACFKESLDTRLKVLHDGHPTVAYSYSNFGLLYLQKGDLENCAKMCDAALALYMKSAKSNVLAHADVYTTYGQCLSRQERFKEALDKHEKALNIRRTQGDVVEVATAETLNYMARISIALKNFPQALRYVSEAKRIALKHPPDITNQLRTEIQITERSLPNQELWLQDVPSSTKLIDSAAVTEAQNEARAAPQPRSTS